MGKVSGEKKDFKRSTDIAQLIYYTLAIIAISMYLLFIWIIPNIDVPLNNITNGTIPLPP